MTKEQVEALLWLWAAWQARLEGGGMGYGVRSPIGRMIRKAAQARGADPMPGVVDMEGIGEKVDRIVGRVPEPYKGVLLIHFVRFPDDGYSVKARVAGCCERTFRTRLDVGVGHVGTILETGVDTLAGFSYRSGTLDSCVRKLA